MRSEAVSSLRNWAKERLSEQEDLLRSLERAIERLTELDHERTQMVETIGACVVRLDALGLDEQQVAAFVGVELAVVRASRTKPAGTLPTRRASTAPVSGEVPS